MHSSSTSPGNLFAEDNKSAPEARHEAQKLAFGAMAFQACRCLRDLGLLELVAESGNQGITLAELQDASPVSDYGVRVLMEASTGTGLCTLVDDSFYLTKTGHFVLRDPMTVANFDFAHHVNYLGFYHLQEAIESGKPAGLKVFGDWDTIYSGLSSLPQPALESWLRFDHFYSDASYDAVLPRVFASNPELILDVGGNTGKWVRACLAYDDHVRVTLADLPQQIALAEEQLKDCDADRLNYYPIDVLQDESELPAGAEVVWMSQFLDCFSEDQIVQVLRKVRRTANANTRLIIMETFWDRQKYEAAAFCLQQISLYFTCLANGNSQMYHSANLIKCIEAAGFEVMEDIDGIGVSHTILECRLSQNSD